MKDGKKTQDISAETSKPRKKPGRQPMTPEEKAAAAKVRAEEKARADNLKLEILVQFQENETSIDTLVEAAKADFRKTKKRTLVTGHEAIYQARGIHGLLCYQRYL